MFAATDFFILSLIAGGGVLLGGFANWRAGIAYRTDLTRWLAFAAIAMIILALALAFWPTPNRSSFRVGFFLALGAGLFGLLALGSRSVVRRTAVPGRIALYSLGALAITLTSAVLAFRLMWGDLHPDQLASS